jgi:hypothetical protein
MSTTRLPSTEEEAMLGPTLKPLVKRRIGDGGVASHRISRRLSRRPYFCSDDRLAAYITHAGDVFVAHDAKLTFMDSRYDEVRGEHHYYWRYKNGEQSHAAFPDTVPWEEQRKVLLVTMKMENS